MSTEANIDTIEAWRAEAELNLRAEYSWLALAGLFWLETGENSMGSGTDNKIVLPAASAPAYAGAFILSEDGQIELRLADGVMAELDDALIISAITMQPDTSGAPNYLYLNDLKMVVIERGGNYAIRLWDKNNPNRLNFGGRAWFAPQAEYQITARFNAYDPPKKSTMVNMLGQEFEGEFVGQIKFELDGTTIQLDALDLPDGELFVMFKDATSGNSSYPPGRYLRTEKRQGNSVVIDFNKAYNPPCAFTDYATCTLPPQQNHLPIAMEVGEKYVPRH